MTNQSESLIYKVLRPEEWAGFQAQRVFTGSAVDVSDGFIHFSTWFQLAETLHKHFAEHTELILLEIDAAEFGDEIKWEESRGGQLFPHLYSELAISSVARSTTINKQDGRFQLPTWAQDRD